MSTRLAIVTTHPIQYNAPLFKLLTERKKISIKVFYTWGESVLNKKYDPGFGKTISWDIPLLEGYEYKFVKNIAKNPGSHHFNGVINPTLITEIKEWQADSLLLFGWSFRSHLKCLRYFHRKIPVLFRGDSTLLDEQKGYKAILKHFLKWIYSYVDYALYVGKNNKDYFLKYGLKEEQLIYAPHAIDNDRFSKPDNIYTDLASKWRTELGIKQNDLVILFAGKLEQKKNPFFIPALAARINNEKIKFIIVGNGILEQDLKSVVTNNKQMTLLDFQNQQQMPVVYRLADIFILPSKGPGETWGLAANEAMACGCALMLSNKAGGAVDLIKNEDNGIVFDPSALDKCINFLKESLANRNKLLKMKQVSKERICNFSFNVVSNTIESVCKKL